MEDRMTLKQQVDISKYVKKQVVGKKNERIADELLKFQNEMRYMCLSGELSSNGYYYLNEKITKLISDLMEDDVHE